MAKPILYWLVALGVAASVSGGCGSNGGAGNSDAATKDATSSPSGSGSSGGSGSGSGSSSGGSSESSSGGDSGVSPPSCAPGGPGMTNCGSASESCCTSLEVTGGTYHRTYNTAQSISGPPDAGWSDEADPATVSGLRIDKYAVTVGRFRQFVAAWNGGSGYTPPSGSGIHTHLNGGRGLANSGSAGTYETGWSTTWNSDIAPTNANLGSGSPNSTWTNTASMQENLPIDFVNWYEAYAFCIWDGGFLPSEAEWEYTAAGGSEQLEYPWGTTAPGTANQYAIYGCYYPSVTSDCAGVASIAPVGTATLGAGLWGQLDMAGNVWQWNLDWYATYVDPCTDCAYLTTPAAMLRPVLMASSRVIRGGLFAGTASGLLPPNRAYGTPSTAAAGGLGGDFFGYGFRCARTP